MELLGTYPDIIYLHFESDAHSKHSGKILIQKKKLLIMEKVDADSADIYTVFVLPEIKSQTFNNLTLSNKKGCQRRMGNTYDKMFS